MSSNVHKGKARGRRSSIPSGYSTKEVARLARVKYGRILSDLGRVGNWRGVEPVYRNPLIWPKVEVNRVLSCAPDREFMIQAEEVLCDLLLEHGLNLDQCWPMVTLLLAKPDPGRDPAYALDDLEMLTVVAAALTDRVDANWPMMTEPQKARAVRSLSYLVSLFDGFTTDENSRSDKDDNN